MPCPPSTHVIVTVVGDPSPIVQEGLPEPPERHGLSFQPLDFILHRLHQHWAGGIPSKPAELVFEMLFGLVGDIPDLLLPL